MTYLEKFYDAMSFISNRHTMANWDDDIPGVCPRVMIEFKELSPRTWNQNAYVLFSITAINKSSDDGMHRVSDLLESDLISLAKNIHIDKPSFTFTRYSGGLDMGVYFVLPDYWENEYMNMEYNEKDDDSKDGWARSDSKFNEDVNSYISYILTKWKIYLNSVGKSHQETAK